MKTKQDFLDSLRRMDHKSYGAYKALKGDYDFRDFILKIDHVQGDPFASPSRVRLCVNNKQNFPAELFAEKWEKTALEDYILRRVHFCIRNLMQGGNGRENRQDRYQRGGEERREQGYRRSGSGKSGMISACRVGQEVMERIAVQISEREVEVRIEVGFPAYGRSIAAEELEKLVTAALPQIVKGALYYRNLKAEELQKVKELADDQEFIREELKRLELCAFVADGSVLPRESGVSERPMKNAQTFVSPESVAVTLQLPNKGSVRGMGIKRGVTLIVGGGYHGKSTLLKAVEAGVYNHISGDGREYVITDASAVKLRAEEGRCVHEVDISMFINHLPNKADTKKFTTENASGSTSQAANTVEGLAGGTKVFLIDEDTSATNFMVRDETMAKLVSDDKEPITPFLKCVRSLWEEHGVSSILVVGSSGAYLSVADAVLQMDNYVLKDVTVKAKELAAPMESLSVEWAEFVKKPIRRKQIEKAKVHGWDTISLDRCDLDLRYLEQLVDEGQTAAMAYFMQYILSHLADGRKTAVELVEEFYREVERKGMLPFVPANYGAGSPVMPRKQEMVECMQRYREI